MKVIAISDKRDEMGRWKSILDITINSIEDIKKHIEISQSGCWIWQPFISTRGYAIAQINKKQVRMSRLTWKLYHNKSIPKGKVIRHLCDNPACVNPLHLIIGSQKENIHDAIKKNRHISPPLHQKLSNDQIKEIRKIGDSKKRKEISKIYNISPSHVSKIILMKTRELK